WTGTMNLTEPHCGTDLGLIRTKAEPQADGTYKISGTKIFISSGEHDLVENIIHLVLAKTTGAPDNVKGISLFIVPKFMVNDDGSLGARNGVTCGSIEHKMGLKGSATCVMNYDGATGFMVGEENKGLAAMFIMMNAARLGVGLQGLSIGDVAFQNGVQYAKDRRQGRALTGPHEPDQKADPIFVHPDVRRMLMEAKAKTEASRALCLWGALQVDLTHNAATEDERQMADDLVGLLTPVIKGCVTDMGYETATNMQQVYGGHGYIAEWGMEQFVRDARIAQIYEGTNGVQALDLVGRKLAKDGGRAVRAFFAIVVEDIAAAKGNDKLADLATRLEKALGELQAATLWFVQNGLANPNNAAAGSYAYMDLMGLVAWGWMWLKMAKASAAELANGTTDKAFHDAKLMTARFYAERVLPDAGALRRKIESGAESMMALPVEAF
ncbi:MAG: acyl-CoA dehydrogenase C-terminal domain-containing protein, partial [Alphaproteobacteria bacterium]|nr:acyl-CoA dehydrogenase C-terminal domain-containing protein [Alphaproteobacteria bacterium]